MTWVFASFEPQNWQKARAYFVRREKGSTPGRAQLEIIFEILLMALHTPDITKLFTLSMDYCDTPCALRLSTGIMNRLDVT